jgi:hypothetical protein
MYLEIRNSSVNLQQCQQLKKLNLTGHFLDFEDGLGRNLKYSQYQVCFIQEVACVFACISAIT